MRHLSNSIVIINQASNYLTIGYANAFVSAGYRVHLITGSIHVQGEHLLKEVTVVDITRWHESPFRLKLFSYVAGLFQMWWLLASRFRGMEVLFISVSRIIK